MEKEVPAYLDEAVLKAATVPVSKPRWKFIVWKVAVPAAAAFAIAAGLLFYQPLSVTGNKGQGIGRQPIKKQNVEKTVVAKDDSGLTENFDEQIFAFALDIGSGMSSVSETLDSVSETMDYMI